MTSSYSTYNPPISLTGNQEPTKYINYDILQKQNPENLCVIQTFEPDQDAKGVEVMGIINSTSKFGLSASAEYKDYMDNLSVFKELQQWSGILSSAANTGQNLRIPQVSFQSLRLSEQQYMGSKLNDLSISLSVPIISQKDNPWDIAINMLEYVIGDRTGLVDFSPLMKDVDSSKGLQVFGNNAFKEFLMYAPHKYHIEWANNDLINNGGAEDSPKGCAKILVGKRYIFNKVLITNVQCNFSNLIYTDGKCTSLDLTISFKPWRMPTISEIASWFNGKTVAR